MTRILNTIGGIIRLTRKLFLGVSGEQVHLLQGMSNVVQAISFLCNGKLGRKKAAEIKLGHAGKQHTWPLIERSDLSVIEEVFLDGEYALHISPPRVILDLGANFGAASVYFAHAWPEARIFAIEPNPSIFARLQSTTASYPSITCINLAMGGQDGMAEFVVSSDHIASSLYRDDADGHRIRVKVQTLATLMSSLGLDYVDLVKFDVEGAEQELFADPAALSRVGNLIGEVHKDLLAAPLETFMACFAGFDVHRRTESAELLVMSAHRRPA